MGHIWGVQPLGRAAWLVGMWILFAVWLALCWSAFIYRETDRGILLTKIDEYVRFLVIPAVLLTSAYSLYGDGPLSAETGQKWFFN